MAEISALTNVYWYMGMYSVVMPLRPELIFFGRHPVQRHSTLAFANSGSRGGDAWEILNRITGLQI